jgi:hypothetical protein
VLIVAVDGRAGEQRGKVIGEIRSEAPIVVGGEVVLPGGLTALVIDLIDLIDCIDGRRWTQYAPIGESWLRPVR